MDNTTSSLGQFITASRKAKGLSENKLASASKLHRSTLRRRLENPDEFTLDELTRISLAIGCKPSKLTALHYTTTAVTA